MRDYHLHTTYSPDGNAQMREQIRAAVDAGLEEICITDHLDLKHHEAIFDVPVPYDRWFAELEALCAEFPTLSIKAGIEAGEQACVTKETLAVVQAHPFDYVLLSQHMIDGVDPYRYEEFLAGRTPAEAYRRYAECVWASRGRFSDFDCLAHLGRDGKALEINTSGLKNGGTSTIPGPDIVRRFVELGGEFVMFGSDAHYTEYVGYEFDRARQMALDCGARYTLTFNQRHGTPVKIDA